MEEVTEASETTIPEGTVDAPEAPPETGTSEQQYDVLSNFKLSDVPEEHREYVELYVKQVQGDYSRKTQELAQQRRQVEEFAQLAERLESEETRDEAMAELARKYGWDVAEEAAEAAGQADEEDLSFRDPRVDELQHRLDQQEQQRQQAEQAEAQRQQEEQVANAVFGALDEYAQKLGVDEVRPEARQQIIALAAAIPRLEGGLPDMASAITAYEANTAAEVQAYLKSKRATVPDASGSSGELSFDPRDQVERLKAANAIADRAMARHA